MDQHPQVPSLVLWTLLGLEGPGFGEHWDHAFLVGLTLVVPWH